MSITVQELYEVAEFIESLNNNLNPSDGSNISLGEGTRLCDSNGEPVGEIVYENNVYCFKTVAA